jgi:hypothetical protein
MLLKDLQNLKKIALANVESDTVARFIDMCYRHYSKTYHTPLKEVYADMTPQQVALYYFEDMLEGLNEEQLAEHREDLFRSFKPILSGDITKRSQEDLVLDDEAWIASQNEMLKKQEAEKKAKQDAELAAKTDEFVKNFSQQLKKIDKAINPQDPEDKSE